MIGSKCYNIYLFFNFYYDLKFIINFFLKKLIHKFIIIHYYNYY